MKAVSKGGLVRIVGRGDRPELPWTIVRIVEQRVVCERTIGKTYQRWNFHVDEVEPLEGGPARDETQPA